MRGFSLFLIAVGAVLAFAVNLVFDEVDLRMVGFILMGVGALGFIAGLISGSATRVVREASADGRQVVEERRTTGM